MADDMSSKEVSQGNEPSEGQAKGLQSFEFVPAGGFPFALQQEISQDNPNILEARIGGGIAGRPPVPSDAQAPERQPTPHGHGVKNLLIAGGATIAGGAAIAAGFLGLDKLRSSDENPNTNPSNDVATQVYSTETVTPAAQETPSPTATKTPEVTPIPVQEVSHGKYATVAEMPVSPDKKAAINELLEGATPFIITDKVIVAIENDLMARPSTIQYAGKEIPVAQLHSIGLNLTDFPDAIERLEKAADLGKYNAWKDQSKNTTVTFDQYQSLKTSQNFPFELWAYDGRSDNKRFQTITEDDPIIFKFLANYDRGQILNSDQFEYTNEIKNNVLSLGIAAPDPGGFKNAINQYGDKRKYSAGSNIAWGLSSLSAHVSKSIVGGVYSLSLEHSRLLPLNTELKKIMNPTTDDKSYGNSIFVVN